MTDDNVAIGFALGCSERHLQGFKKAKADNASFNMVAQRQGASIKVTWNNPKGVWIKVVRKIGSYPVNENDGVLVFQGPNTSGTDTYRLVHRITYYYRMFRY